MTVRSTHAVEMADGLVVKRFCSWERGEHQREWQALNLLAEFAPGLAPAPVSADLDADPPAITMTRLPGEPLAGQPVAARHLDALVSTLDYLHMCVPASALDWVRPHQWIVEGPASRLRSRTAGMRLRPDVEPVVRAEFSVAAGWLDRVAEPSGPVTSVFGQGDGYLGNFLWDGSCLGVVDFEDSGDALAGHGIRSRLESICGPPTVPGQSVRKRAAWGELRARWHWLNRCEH